jgi:hypothetical protein
VSIVLYTMPLVILDGLILYYLEWGSQLFITCMESGLLALVTGFLNVFDNCCRCSRLSYIDEKELEEAALLARKKAMDDQMAYAGY